MQTGKKITGGGGKRGSSEAQYRAWHILLSWVKVDE
jgi:hypothetical protein